MDQKITDSTGQNAQKTNAYHSFVRKNMAGIKIGILLLSIGFIVAGVLRGEVKTVLSKAIKLCLECVGIG